MTDIPHSVIATGYPVPGDTDDLYEPNGKLVVSAIVESFDRQSRIGVGISRTISDDPENEHGWRFGLNLTDDQARELRDALDYVLVERTPAPDDAELIANQYAWAKRLLEAFGEFGHDHDISVVDLLDMLAVSDVALYLAPITTCNVASQAYHDALAAEGEN